MAETQTKADSAEKAYAEAAAKVEVAAKAEPEFVPAPALVAEVAAPAPKADKPEPKAEPKAEKADAKPEPVKAAPKPVKVAKPAAAAKASPKPRRAAAKPAVKAVRVKSAAPKAVKPKLRATKPAATTRVPQTKENIMATTKKTTTEFSQSLKSALTDAQGKAKVAYDKGQAAFGDAAEFTKGNVEALVESTKILGSGLQELTSGYVAESRSAFETLTADVKALAAVKSPTDFFKLQGEIMRRNFDKAVTFGSKNSEAMLKLTSEVAAPIQGRVNLAVEKVKQAA